MTQNKEDLLFELARKRQHNRYEGYTGIGDYDEGVWECDYVSPYTKSAHDVEADVLVLLQDWCSHDWFKGVVCKQILELGHDPANTTNVNLKQFLSDYLELSLGQTYATNLFPFIKPGGMNTPIPLSVMARAAEEYTIPMIEIVGPKVVLCMGKLVGDGLRRAFGIKREPNIGASIANPFWLGSSRVFTLAHPGRLGTINRKAKGKDTVRNDWLKVARFLESAEKED